MPGRAARARRPVTSRQRGRSARGGPARRLTGRARVARWTGIGGRRLVVDGPVADLCGRCRAAGGLGQRGAGTDRLPRPLPSSATRRPDGRNGRNRGTRCSPQWPRAGVGRRFPDRGDHRACHSRVLGRFGAARQWLRVRTKRPTARRVEAIATVTRMGGDRLRGLRSAKPTRARAAAGGIARNGRSTR